MAGTKTFFDAVRSGDMEQVRSLLHGDPSLASAENDSGASALLLSIYTGRSEIRELLLSAGAVMHLPEATAAGNLDRVRPLVDRNPALARSFSPDGFPLFALACFFGHRETAEYLAEKGADIHARASNGTGYNALTASVAAGHTEIVGWLLERGLDPNYRYGQGYSPLLTAAANGHLEIVKLLLNHGAELRATTDDGKSAVTIATERHHAQVAHFLRARSTSAGR